MTEWMEKAASEWKKQRNLFPFRLALASICLDFASGLKLPGLWEESQADWIAKTFGLDVHLFGITNEGARQYNAFFYPETYAHVDSEAVISLLHLFFKQNPLVGHARELVAYADSCGGQNRNRYVVAYWISRVLDGYHEKVHFNFLIVGHTKFAPDQLFGLIHALFKKHDFIVPADLPPKVKQYGQQGRQTGEKKWTANATLVEEADEVFRKFKSLAASYNPIKGIKKMAIESILFEAQYIEGVRTVKVSYKLVEKAGYNEVAVLKRGGTWPERGVLDDDNLPDVIPWKRLSNTRYQSLLKSIDKISGQVTDDHRQFYESLPHRNPDDVNEDDKSPSQAYDRGGNPVSDDESAPASPESAPDSPSCPLSPVFGPNDAEDGDQSPVDVDDVGAVEADMSVTPANIENDGSQSPAPHSDDEMDVSPGISRTLFMSMLAPNSYDLSSRYLRNVASMEGKRRRISTKDDDFV